MTKKRRRKRRNPGRCLCGSGNKYRLCCRPFHRREATAQSPVELMRSRYSAYAKGKVDYIIETTDPGGEAWQKQTEKWRDEIREFGKNMRFLGVRILDSTVDDTSGEVEFHAKLKKDRHDVSFVERSQFVCRNGRWLYSSGIVAT